MNIFTSSKAKRRIFFSLFMWHPLLYAAPLTLQDVLSAATEKYRFDNQSSINQAELAQPAASWLANTPSVSLLYLHNQQSWGSKETEISVNLPIKSRLQREIDQQLRLTTPLIKQHALAQQALFLSGLIRFTLWEYQQHLIYTKQNEHKLSVLNTLLQHYEKLSKAGNSPSYLTLLVKQETIQSRLALLDHQTQANKLLTEYRLLTGLNAFPNNLSEDNRSSNVDEINQHPDIQALDASWQVYVAKFNVSTQQAQPWNISVSAKRINTAGLSENQIGLGVEMPFSMGNNTNQSQYTEFSQAQSQYLLERGKLSQQIQQAMTYARAQLQLSQSRQTLLIEALNIADQLQATLDNLLLSKIADQEWILRRTLEIVDTQAQYAVNQLKLQKHVADLNQAAGKSL